MSMFLYLVKKNLMEILRDLKKNILLFSVPIFIFSAIYTYVEVSEIEVEFVKPIIIGVVVEDESPYSQMLVNDFQGQKNLSDFLQIIEGEHRNIQDQFENKAIDAMVVIPNGYVEALMRFEYLPMDISIRNEDPLKAMVLYNGLRGYEAYISSVELGVTAFYDLMRDTLDEKTYWDYNDGLSVELIMTVLQRNQIYNEYVITNIPRTTSGAYYFLALLMTFIMYLSLFGAISLLRESETMSYQRLMLTDVSVTTYLLAKSVTYVVGIAFLTSIWTNIFNLFMTSETINYSIEFIFFIFSIIFVSVLASMCLTIFIKQEEVVLLFSGVFIFFTTILGGAIIPIHYMPEGLKNIGQWTPNFHMTRIALFLGLEYAYPAYIYIQCGIVLLGCILFYILSKHYKKFYMKGTL